MAHFHPDDAGPPAPRTLAEVEPPPPHPFWLTVVATLGGLVIPAIVAISAAYLLGPPRVAHASRAAALAAAALTVAEAIFAGLGAAALVEAGWRRLGLPGSGPANFLPLRWIRHRIAHRHVQSIIARLRESPPQPSRESVRALLDLSRELARRDIYTRAHSGRVSRLSVEVGQKIGLRPEECEMARLAGLLHDIGKLEIPSSILNKPGPLDPDEAELVRSHPTIGAALVAPYIGAGVVNAVLHHHERVDGAGYPQGVDGDALPTIARLVPVVDTYDALISDRAYRPGRSREEAFMELRAVAGTQLDPELVEALIEVESAKVAFGGALLGLSPVSTLLRRAEHLLHGSAAPAAAAVTAVAVAGAGWLGVISSAGGTHVSASRFNQSIVKTSPSATPSDESTPTDSPSPPDEAAQNPTDSPVPSPSVGATGKVVAPLFFPTATGKPTGKGTTAATGVLVTPPQTRNTGGVPVKATNPTIVVVGPPVRLGNPPPNPPGNPGPTPNPTQPPPPPPSIGGISPTGGSSGTAVTIRGANLSCVTSVTFGGAPAVISSNDGSTLQVTTPSGRGNVPVVASGSCGSATWNSFQYMGPVITTVYPLFGSINGGTPVTISGSGFNGALSVKIGDADLLALHLVVSVADTAIAVQSPSFQAAGSQQEVNVCVTTPVTTTCTGHDTGNPKDQQFDYGPNMFPGINPASESYQGGIPVTVNGSNFSGAGATWVTFGGGLLAATVNNDKQLQFTPPPWSGSPSTRNSTIQVLNGAGLSDNVDAIFSYQLPPPVVTGVSPQGGPATGTVVVYISGNNFISLPNAPASVSFGAAAASGCSVNAPNSITCTAPPGLRGMTVDVIVSTASGPSQTNSSDRYTYS